MVRHLSRMSDNVKNKKKVIAIREILKHNNKTPAKALEKPLQLTSRQVAFFLKRMDVVSREKDKGRYVYSVEKHNRLEFGDEWIEVKGSIVRTSLNDVIEVKEHE